MPPPRSPEVLAAVLVPGFFSIITRSFLKSLHTERTHNLSQSAVQVAAARQLTFMCQQYPAILPWCGPRGTQGGAGRWECVLRAPRHGRAVARWGRGAVQAIAPGWAASGHGVALALPG